MRRLALVLATAALTMTGCGTHVQALPTAVRASAVSAKALPELTIAKVTRTEAAGRTTVQLDLTGTAPNAAVAVFDTHDDSAPARLTGLTLNGQALKPGAQAFMDLVTQLEDARMAPDFEDQWTVNWVLAALEQAAPPKANGWTMTKQSFGGGDGEGFFKATFTKGGVTHELHVELTDLGGLKSDTIRGIELDGQPVGEGQGTAIESLRLMLDGVKVAKAADLPPVRLVVALLRQQAWAHWGK